MDRVVGDTICAIATPIGEGGIGIVRISGPGALAVGDKVVRLRSKRRLTSVSSHRFHVADVVSAAVSEQLHAPLGGETNREPVVIDEALVVCMKAPRSFTGEDVVEIHCHGSVVVLGLVCAACLDAGARLADPGEFTKRAFLNGRLDLSQAEAVLETIRATSEASLRMAQRNLRGELGRQISKLRAHLLSLLSEVEAGIDFGEEEVSFVDRSTLLHSLQETLAEIQRILDCSTRGRRLREGARVVIVGPPNVGKSSLLNILVGEERAIVTDVPGTTRDTIEESVVWDGLMITLVDTAGLRETEDVVEQEGIKRARSAVEQGDLVLQMIDATKVTEDCGSWPGVIPVPEGRKMLIVMNKSDLVESGSIAKAASLIEARLGGKVIATSVRTGTGIESLRLAIRSCLAQPSLEANEGAVFTNARHRHALERARVALQHSLDSVRNGVAAELVAVDLRGAADALGEVTGVITSDEILNEIFSTFCIGK